LFSEIAIINPPFFSDLNDCDAAQASR